MKIKQVNTQQTLVENLEGKYSDKFYQYLKKLFSENDLDSMNYLAKELIRYGKEDDLKDLWLDKFNNITMEDDIEESIDDEIPYTKEQVIAQLQQELSNLGDEGKIKYGYLSEAETAQEFLDKYYASVELDKVGSWFQIDFKGLMKSKKEELEEDVIEMTSDEMRAKYGTDSPDIINTGRPEEEGTVVLKEAIATHIYLFPELTDEDMSMAKAYGLQYLGKNHGAHGSEDNWVVAGDADSLRRYAEKWLGYELHPDYLYDADDFAGEIINEI